MKVKLESVAQIVTGGTPSTEKPEYWNNGTISWLQSGCCQNCYVSKADKFITQAGYDNSSTRMMSPDTIMIALTGATAGKVGYLTFNACGNQSITGITANKEKLIPKYLYYFLINRRQKTIADCKGGAQPHISQGYVKNIELVLKTLAEQKQIVAELDKYTTAIALEEKQLLLLDELIQSRFVEMFGDPVTNSYGHKQVPFSNFITGIRYGTSQPPQFSECGEFKFIRATNIKQGYIIDKDMLCISAEEASKIEKCKLYENEIIIVRSGANTGDTCVITKEYANQYAGYDIIVTLDLERANPMFFNQLLNTSYMQFVVKPLTVRSAQPHLNAQQILKLPMIVVPIREQKQFADFVSQIDHAKDLVRHRIKLYTELLDKKMDEYFN